MFLNLYFDVWNTFWEFQFFNTFLCAVESLPLLIGCYSTYRSLPCPWVVTRVVSDICHDILQPYLTLFTIKIAFYTILPYNLFKMRKCSSRRPWSSYVFTGGQRPKKRRGIVHIENILRRGFTFFNQQKFFFKWRGCLNFCKKRRGKGKIFYLRMRGDSPS